MGEGAARYAVVGTGWRARFYLRLAALLPDRFVASAVVTRSAASGAEIEGRFGVPAFQDLAALARDRPDFVVTAVPREINPGLVEALVRLGVPVLSETPPAGDLDGLHALWARVGGSGLVQVAEQYLLLPANASRLAVVRNGMLGSPTSAQVSSTHGYHAVSVIRGMLGVRFEEATVCAQTFTAPLADPVSRSGWSGDGRFTYAETTIATVDFGDQMGLYDFTDNQWWNPLRSERIVVRGSRGELVDDCLVRLVDPFTPVETVLRRRQTGLGGNLEGFGLDHVSFDGEIVYRNPFRGAPLADEDIAIASLLDRTGAWARGKGEPPYPLADACQDQLIALAIAESAASGQPVVTPRQGWAER